MTTKQCLRKGETVAMNPIEKRIPIQPHEAIAKILSLVKGGKVERIDISLANGRYLAEELVADHPVPSFDRSSFDGYAIRSKDTEGASFDRPCKLTVIESIAAGEVANLEVGTQQAIRIMTGAQLPKGADSVIGLELVKEIMGQDGKQIELNRFVSQGDNVSHIGEDTKQGTVLAKKGRRISAGEMAMLATFGYHEVKVYKRPVIGVYVTGTELLAVNEPLVPGKIRNSNSYMLLSQIKNAGAIPKYYGILPDNFKLCFEAVSDALQEVDYLITTGGASVGDFDFVQEIIQKLDATLLFNKVAMRPGSVTTVATKGEKWIFGLSGNPSACYVGFELFMRPVIKAALGSEEIHLPKSQAVLMHDLDKSNVFTRFIRAKVEIRGAEVQISTVGVDKSGIASSLIEANSFLVVQGGTKLLRKGDLVEVIWLDQMNEGTIYV
jgi:molybdopterin molybdotransferase